MLHVAALRTTAGYQICETPTASEATSHEVAVARAFFNASVPLTADGHTGVLPKAGGVHHYPTPITDIEYTKHDDFELWVTDDQGEPAAVAPIGRRGSGDGRVRVLYATPGTQLHAMHAEAHAKGKALVLDDDSPMAKQALARQPS